MSLAFSLKLALPCYREEREMVFKIIPPFGSENQTFEGNTSQSGVEWYYILLIIKLVQTIAKSNVCTKCEEDQYTSRPLER